MDTATTHPGEALLIHHHAAMIEHMAHEQDIPLDYATEATEQLWDRLTRQIRKDHPELPDGFEYRIMDQAIGFLALCGHDSSVSYAPSELVDIGWHTFILHTLEYFAFCELVAGHYIHHAPDNFADGAVRAGASCGKPPCAGCKDCCKGGKAGAKSSLTAQQTRDLLALFWPVDQELWQQ